MEALLIVGLVVVVMVIGMAVSGGGGSVSDQHTREIDKRLKNAGCRDCGLKLSEMSANCPRPNGFNPTYCD
jgi:hypothetical protein